MRKNIIFPLTIVGLIVAIIVTVFSMYVSYNRTEVNLRSQAKAQLVVIEGGHDVMWKTIKQQASVKDSYAEDFGKVYKDMFDARYSKGDGTLMKWIKEANPTLDVSIYKQLMNTIEIQRTAVKNAQDRLADIIREHDALLNDPIKGIFIKNDVHIEQIIISSTKTKEVMKTGTDDDVDI